MVRAVKKNTAQNRWLHLGNKLIDLPKNKVEHSTNPQQNHYKQLRKENPL